MLTDPDLYDHIAKKWDIYSERTCFPITECLLEMTGVKIDERVLDVACGTGIVARQAARIVGSGGIVTGIDLSPGMISLASNRAKDEGYKCASFYVMDATHLAFQDKTFDVVVAQLPHFYYRKQFVDEIFRVLKSGGRCAICKAGFGSKAWPLNYMPDNNEMNYRANIDGLFKSLLVKYFPDIVEEPIWLIKLKSTISRLFFFDP